MLEEVEAPVARVGTHPIWGYGHCCLRVHALAESLAADEGLTYDAEILRIAALLHDAGPHKAYAHRREGPDHARRSAAVADRILKDRDFPPHAARVVMEAIEHHPPGAPPAPRPRRSSSRTPSPWTTSAR